MPFAVRVRDVVIPPEEFSWRFSRSAGPGGQSVNTSDSRVELSYDLATSDALPRVLKERAMRKLGARLAGGVLTVSASEHRSQLRNRQAAAKRLAALLEAATSFASATAISQAGQKSETERWPQDAEVLRVWFSARPSAFREVRIGAIHPSRPVEIPVPRACERSGQSPPAEPG